MLTKGSEACSTGKMKFSERHLILGMLLEFVGTMIGAVSKLDIYY